LSLKGIDPAVPFSNDPNPEKNEQKQEEKSALIAQQVMHRIGQDSLKPNPHVFAILYAHYTGTHPDISHEIQDLDHEKKTLTTTLCEKLFEKYLSANKEKEFFDESARKVQAVASEIVELIRGAGMAHKEYSQQLERQTSNFSGSSDIEQVKKIVAELVSDTRRMIDENHKLEEKLHDSAHELQQMRNDVHHLKQETMRDTLTGVPNRRAFDNELKIRAAESIDKQRPLCLIMIDIDHFKAFNDTYGHPVGDQVLRLVARTLEEGLRSTEMLARYGGEEFAVIVPNIKLRDCEKVAHRLRERIATKDIVNQSKNEKLGRLTVSLGIAQLQPGEAISEFIDRSDRALYKSKEAGRNRVTMIEYDKSLHESHLGDIVIDADK
jgi:diguanylate cyclase